MRLAGIIKEYSASAMPHENNMTTTSGQLRDMPDSCNLRCPYHASVINTFDTMRRKTVDIAGLIFVFLTLYVVTLCFQIVKYAILHGVAVVVGYVGAPVIF